jgi:hypothetical protein
MASAHYEKVAPIDLEDNDSDFSGSEHSSVEAYTGCASRRSRTSEDTRKYDRETLGVEEEVERLLAGGEKSGSGKRKKAKDVRMEEGGKDSASDSGRSSGDELRPLGQAQGMINVSLPRDVFGMLNTVANVWRFEED